MGEILVHHSEDYVGSTCARIRVRDAFYNSSYISADIEGHPKRKRERNCELIMQNLAKREFYHS